MDARKILEGLDGVEAVREITQGKTRKKHLTQFLVSGNVYSPMGDVDTVSTLEAGIYDIKYKGGSYVYEVHELKTDEILRFEDERYNTVLNEISHFWTLKKSFDEMGFTHKRGVLLFGVPGSGKSCLTKLVMEDTVNKGDIVFIAKDSSGLVTGLEHFREVEPERKCLVVIEDIDELVRYHERPILELFDGDSQMDNLVILATTNYPDRLPPRVLRAGRFDRKIEIKNPPKAGRLAYLKHKLAIHEDESKIDELAEKTKGFSFGQLREFLVSTYCLGQDVDLAIKRITVNMEESALSEAELDEQLRTVFEVKAEGTRVNRLFESLGVKDH